MVHTNPAVVLHHPSRGLKAFSTPKAMERGSPLYSAPNYEKIMLRRVHPREYRLVLDTMLRRIYRLHPDELMEFDSERYALIEKYDNFCVYDKNRNLLNKFWAVERLL